MKIRLDKNNLTNVYVILIHCVPSIKLMAITLSILYAFSKFFHCCKDKYISNKTNIILPTVPSVC